MSLARDPFLATVSKGVRLSDDGIWRDFFYVGEDDATVLCYQRASDARPRVCVPKECRAVVLRAAHGEPLSGHSDIARTVAVVSGSYYWPTLYADVAHFVRTCPACNAAKSSSQARMCPRWCGLVRPILKARASAPKRPTGGRQLPASRVQPCCAARAGV